MVTMKVKVVELGGKTIGVFVADTIFTNVGDNKGIEWIGTSAVRDFDLTIALEPGYTIQKKGGDLWVVPKDEVDDPVKDDDEEQLWEMRLAECAAAGSVDGRVPFAQEVSEASS